MISLLLTLFISLFSICPAFNKVDQVENINTYSALVKRSTTYDEHSGYTSSYLDLACAYCWDNMEDVFGTAYGPNTSDYGDFIYYQNFAVSGLYVNVPNYYPYQNAYTMMEDYAVDNGLKVNSIYLFNRVFSPWSPDYEDDGPSYYAHRIDFVCQGGREVHAFFYKDASGGQGAGTYSCEFKLYYDHSYHTLDFYNYSLFATDNFTFGGAFKDLYYWDVSIDTEQAINDAYREGYSVGINVADEAGYTRGYGEGYAEGQQDGYAEGLAHADYDSTALTIMSGIIDVALLPVNVFLMILNFEVFGVNISGAVSALLTISIVIIIVRFLFGGKNDDK